MPTLTTAQRIAFRKKRVDELCRDYMTDERELPNLVVDYEIAHDVLREEVRILRSAIDTMISRMTDGRERMSSYELDENVRYLRARLTVAGKVA